jgi:hypothetical protein
MGKPRYTISDLTLDDLCGLLLVLESGFNPAGLPRSLVKKIRSVQKVAMVERDTEWGRTHPEKAAQ